MYYSSVKYFTSYGEFRWYTWTMTEKKKLSVRGLELVRDFNIVTAVGKVAIGAMFPVTALVMYPWAAFDALQAGGAHLASKHLDKKKKQA